MLNVINEHNYQLANFRADSKKIFTRTLGRALRDATSYQSSQQSLSVAFYNEEEITLLNKKYRQQEKESDVLSFSADPKFTADYLGDIIICYPVATRQALEYAHSLRRELAFLFLHGLLHLLGYDHAKSKDEIVMFTLQEEILGSLGITRKNSPPLVRGRKRY